LTTEISPDAIDAQLVDFVGLLMYTINGIRHRDTYGITICFEDTAKPQNYKE
jgi:hypothetical protein